VFHMKNVMKKLGTVNRHQALAVAMRMGIVD
jgi:DNA-binding CsgD family transcriptional regulator